jgi:hypothetical protein
MDETEKSLLKVWLNGGALGRVQLLVDVQLMYVEFHCLASSTVLACLRKMPMP